MYTAYLFDFDLTLVDSSDAIAMCFNKTLASLGRDTVPPDTVKRTIGLPMRVAVGKIIGTDNAAVIESFIQSYQPFADRYMTDNTIFFPRTVATHRAEKSRRGDCHHLIKDGKPHRREIRARAAGSPNRPDNREQGRGKTEARPRRNQSGNQKAWPQ